jgi:hypothetical protein
MPAIQWINAPTTLPAFGANPPFEIQQPWLAALDSFGESTLLRVRAEGSWTPFEGLPACGPDGLAGVSYPETGLVITDCLVGALIGRIGGSSATLKAASADTANTGETKAFAIGSYCVLRIPEKALGPLFIGFNSLARPVRLQSLTLTLETARA